MTGYDLTPSVWLTVASACFMLSLAALLWRRRDVRGALPLATQALIVAAMCVALAAETAATGDTARRAWFVVRSALVLPSGLSVLWFALEYASFRRLLTRPLIAICVGSVLLQWGLYAPFGGALIWSRTWWDGEVRGSLAPLGFLFTTSAFGIFILATGILILLFVRSPAHRGPVAFILLGQVAVRLVYPTATLKLFELPNAATVLVFDFAALMYAVALLRLRLFDLVPVARETILARMPDGLLVLDARGRIADINEAALRLIDGERHVVLGRSAADALAAAPELARCVLDGDRSAAEASHETADGTATYEITQTPLADWQGHPIGRLVMIHDITVLRAVETKLLERERSLAASAERERLARELHDGLAQELWLAKLKTTRLAGQTELGSEARSLTDEIAAAVDAGIVEARQAVATMRVSDGQNGSLQELLARTLEEFEDRFGLPVEFDSDDGLPGLASRPEAETLRIVGEALTNARRHADATLVRVRAYGDEGCLVLEVRDNGRGFDPTSVGGGRYGLAGMRERAAQIGAEIEIESAPRKGTCVCLRVPFPPDAPSERAAR